MAEMNRTKEVLEFIWDKFELFIRRTFYHQLHFLR